MNIFEKAKERKIQKNIKKQQELEEKRLLQEKAEKELEEKAYDELDDIFGVEPIKRSSGPQERLLGFRVVHISYGYRDEQQSTVSKKGDVIQLFSKEFDTDVVLLHNNLTKVETMSITKQLEHNLIDKYCFKVQMYKMADPINVVERALSFILPEFDAIEVMCDVWKSSTLDPGTQELPYPQKADTTKLITVKQLSELSEEPFESFMSTYLLWVKNNGAAEYLGISRELSDKLYDEYFEYTDALGKECDERYKDPKDEAGVAGEQEVSYHLSWLDADYVVMSSVDEKKKLRLKNPAFKNEPQEYDHIVVGKQGVFLVETKNYSGKIDISEAGNWVRKQGSDLQAIENPVAQIRRHEKLMKSILSDYPGVEVVSVICLADKNVVITGEKYCKIPVLRADSLTEFIETYQSESVLDKEKVKDISEVINSFKV